MAKKILTSGLVVMLVLSGLLAAALEEGINVGNYVSAETDEKLMQTSISDWHDLHNIRNNLDGYYVLTNDLTPDTAGYLDYNGPRTDGWLPIGDHIDSFAGVFDGQGYEIVGLYIYRPSSHFIGFFGFIGDGCEVRNVGVVDANVSGDWVVGGLVGWSHYRSVVSNSYATGRVSGNITVGGLVGFNDGNIENSYATVGVNGFADGINYYNGGAGGLVGYNSGTVSNSYATGSVSGNITVGGLVGFNEGTIENSYSTGTVSGLSSVGGLVGSNHGAVSNSFYNIDSVLINDGHHITIGGIFNEEYEVWLDNGFRLDITDHRETLVPVDDHYEISTVDGLRDLLGFADRQGYVFHLVADIDLSLEPNLYIPYIAADFYGNNHSISNIYVNMPFASNVGLFGHVFNSLVTDIHIVDAHLIGGVRVGGLAGQNGYDRYEMKPGTISNSYVTGNITGDEQVGGLVGLNSGMVENSYVTGNITGDEQVGGLVGLNRGTVENSSATGKVNGSYSTGGLLGRNRYGTVSNTYATGEVSGDSDVGGLVGWNKHGTVSNSYGTGDVYGTLGVGSLVGNNGGTITNSYATGNVSGSRNVGGLVGRNSGRVVNSYAAGNVNGEDWGVGGLVGSNGGTITNSYATGDVRGDKGVGGLSGDNWRGNISNSFSTGIVIGDGDTGGLMGNNWGGTVSNSFWDMETSGTDVSGGGIGKTSAEMMDITTFTHVGWDIVSVADTDHPNPDYTWNIVDTETYPFLSGKMPDEDIGDNGPPVLVLILMMIIITAVFVLVFRMNKKMKEGVHSYNEVDYPVEDPELSKLVDVRKER